MKTWFIKNIVNPNLFSSWKYFYDWNLIAIIWIEWKIKGNDRLLFVQFNLTIESVKLCLNIASVRPHHIESKWRNIFHTHEFELLTFAMSLPQSLKDDSFFVESPNLRLFVMWNLLVLITINSKGKKFSKHSINMNEYVKKWNFDCHCAFWLIIFLWMETYEFLMMMTIISPMESTLSDSMSASAFKTFSLLLRELRFFLINQTIVQGPSTWRTKTLTTTTRRVEKTISNDNWLERWCLIIKYSFSE